MTQIKDGASQQHKNKAASTGSDVDTLSTNVNNMSITNTEDSVLKGAEGGKESEIPCTSCAQNLVDCKNDIGRALEQYTLGRHADKNLISNDDLFNNDPPPKEDCPICMQPIPHSSGLCGVHTSYMPCCGKVLCFGCTIAEEEEINKGNLKKWCAFCRLPLPETNKEKLRRYHKRMELNDANAFFVLGCAYQDGLDGNLGLSKDMKKASELLIQAADLGSCRAHYHIGQACLNFAIEKDDNETQDESDIDMALHYMKLAAIGGHEKASYYLGLNEALDGNSRIAMKHYIIGARGGFEECLKKVGEGYKAGHVTKDEYATTLRAYQSIKNEMKSKQRVIAAAAQDIFLALERLNMATNISDETLDDCAARLNDSLKKVGEL